MKAGLLGDVYHARLVWHRNGNWRRKGDPPSPDYDASRWGYPTWDHLINWRLYKRYSNGLHGRARKPRGEHHQLVLRRRSRGGRGHRRRLSASRTDREVPDHMYVTFEYPGGRTAVFTSIESNAFDHYYERTTGRRARCCCAARPRPTSSRRAAGRRRGRRPPRSRSPRKPPVRRAPRRRAGRRTAAGSSRGAGAGAGGGADRLAAYRYEVYGFCSAIRRAPPSSAARSAMARPRRAYRRSRRSSTKQRVVLGEGLRRCPHGAPGRALPHEAGVRLLAGCATHPRRRRCGPASAS